MSSKLKDSFSKMIEQAKEWDSSGLSEGRKTHRYYNLISFIEEKILPFTKNNPCFSADVSKGLGFLYDMTSNPKKASLNLEKARKIFFDAKDRKGLAETYILIGDMHRDYGRFRQALRSYERAIDASKNSQELSNLEAEGLLGIGDLHRLKGNYGEALEYLRKAKRIYRKNKYVVGINEVLWVGGYTYLYMGRYRAAEKTFRQIIEYCGKGLVDETHRSSATGALGDVYRLTGRYEKSLELYREAEESMDIEGNSSERAWILAMMGHSYLQLNMLADAKRSILKAENLSRKTNNDTCLIWAIEAKAELEKSLGRIHEAGKIYHESQQIAKSYGMKLELAHSYLGLAEIERQTKRKDVSLYKKALQIYKDIGCQWGIRECQNRMSTVQDIYYKERPLNFP